MRWIVGDIQGCAREFDELLSTIRFDPARDELWSLGDIINRGPESLAALRLWKSVGGRGLIGNHEIKALLSHSGRRPRKLKLLKELFRAHDAAQLFSELRALTALEHLASNGDGPDAWIVHAGVDPRWGDLHRTATRLNNRTHDDDWLTDADVQFATNVRCCTQDGERCDHNGPPQDCPAPFLPWDAFYRGPTLMVHGHWAARGYYRTRQAMGLDSACVYGGSLTAWCQDEDRIVQVPSRQPS